MSWMYWIKLFVNEKSYLTFKKILDHWKKITFRLMQVDTNIYNVNFKL